MRRGGLVGVLAGAIVASLAAFAFLPWKAFPPTMVAVGVVAAIVARRL